MNRAILSVAAALCGWAVVVAQAPETLKSVVTSYLEIQAHLAADRISEIKSPAQALATHAKALGPAGEGVAKAAAAVESAADIKAARDAFGPLSDAVVARVQADGSKELLADLRLAYCPMVKRSWLQREEQIKNPYYGSQMSNCGEFKPLKK